MKWINATHLKQWADTRDCQEVLPELILRLIHATSSHISKVKFPSGDSVHLSGWDGILDNKEKIYCFEPGISLWEIGSNQNVKNKANDDYEKRRLNSLGYDKKETIFVFVTPRIWDGAEAWTIEKKAENVWKNIVVLTAIELEDWLSLCPIVSLWLAEQLRNIKLSQISTVGSFWQKWSTGKNIVLNPDILLGGRRKEQDDLYQRLEMPSTVIIQSMAQEESLAFSVACILMHPNTQELNSRCIIVRNEDVLDRLIDEYDNLIFIADVGNKNHTYATQKGHSIIYATSIAEVPKTDKIISLPLIERDAFITSLESSGISRDNAEQLSRETVRNITILRRRLGLDYTLPEWAQAQNIHDLIPSILIGRWNDKVDGDKEILSLIANEPYDSYVRKLHRWLNSNDTPLVNVDGIWRIISPYDAFTNAANYISSIDFQRFEQVLLYVANDVDPDAMAKMETSSLAFWENKQKYSGWLKEGIFQSAILISLLSENITIMSPQLGNIWIDNIINSLLQTSNLEWWFSYKHIMPQIAESSPRSFVSFINDDLTKDDASIIKKLFTPKNNSESLFGPKENYTNILFALENLIWEKEFLLPISLILAELSRIENSSNLGNKPINTLVSVYKVWHPQTFADVNERNQALETVIKKYPEVGFQLCIKLLDRLDHDTSIATHPMRWRCFGQQKPVVFAKDINKSINAICNMLIENCNKSASQICQILDISTQFAIGTENRKLLFDFVSEHYIEFAGNVLVADKIRTQIYHHRSFPDAQWALPNDEIKLYEGLLPLVEPQDKMQKYLWMFKDSYLETQEIDRHNHDYQKRWGKTIEIRNKALADIYKDFGIIGICNFANNVKCPFAVGCSFAYIANNHDFKYILGCIKEEKVDKLFAKGFFANYAHHYGLAPFIQLIDMLKQLDKEIIYFPLSSVQVSKDIYEYVDKQSEDIQNKYWKNVSLGIYEDPKEASYIINKLNQAKRFVDSIDVIHLRDNKLALPSEIIVDTLILLIHSPQESSIHNKQYELADIISELDKREDVDSQKIIQIEFLFYRLLERYGKAYDIKLINEIMSNPDSMMEIIKMVYLPSDEKRKATELNELTQSPNYIAATQLALNILWNIRRTPYVNNKTYEIDESRLNIYVEELRRLGQQYDREESTNYVIGELLANYPERNDYPPKAICEIIEKLNNKHTNNGFRSRIFNKRGVTVRPALEGGTLETAEAAKYKKYADSIRYTYPLIANIFDSLSREYKDMAIKDENRTKIEAMEY